ncbi:MAG: hypothetical protein Kow0099_15220 [Candidatus Abyssubacteria bacterium]
MDKSQRFISLLLVTAVLCLVWTGTAPAAIDGITGPNFTFTAKTNYISCADGLTLQIWGFANGAGPAQYPGTDGDY